ncbi:MAG: DNA primase [Vallitalea sp.]|jgi:DNA primase|nr:DNA primase [Vallitalea sp.]
MYYPEELIEEIRVQNDIVDVISSHVQLNKKGNAYFGLCPFHNEKTPSFAVNSDKQMYYCFGCGAGGNVYTFVMEYENFSFVEAIKYLADRVHITLPTVEVPDEVKRKMDFKHLLLDINKSAARYFYYQLKSDKGKNALNYLNKRGISEETQKKFGLGYSNIFRNDLYRYLSEKYDDKALAESGLVIPEKKVQGEFFDRFFNRVMFPIFDVHNRVIGFGGRILSDSNPKYLNSPETKLFDKSRNLYGLNFARSSRKDSIIIVEGYMDVISLFQAGITNVVASLGTAFTMEQAALLKRYTNNVIMSYDSDGAGIKATLRAIPILKSKGLSVRVLRVEQYKDPDEYIKNKGSEAFNKLLDKAIPSFMFEIEELGNKYNLDDPASRTKFQDEVATKLLGLENELERDNYMEAISKKYNTKKQLLEKVVNEKGKNTGIVTTQKEVKYVKKNNNIDDGITLAQRSILILIANSYDIYKVVKKYLDISEFSNEVYQKVAKEVYETYDNKGKIEPAVIINKFIELEHQNMVARLFNNKVSFENKMQLEKIINDSVRLIKSYNIDINSRVINDTSELQKLILAKRELQVLHISLNDG